MIEQFESLMERANSLPYGDMKVSLLEEAVRLADTYQDTLRGYDARMELTAAAIHSGKPEKAFVSFSWCLNQFDSDPMQHDAHKLMWYYKWIADDLISFPEITLEQIETVLNDLKKRFTEMGYNNRVYYQLRFLLAWHRGKFELAEQELTRWQAEMRDSISNCPACDLDLEIGFLLTLGRFKEAFEKAKPILKGDLNCQSVPHSTYSGFLLPLLKEGLWEEAQSFHEQGYRLIHGKQGFLSIYADHLKYLTIADPDKAMSCLENTCSEALSSRVPNTRFSYFLSAAILLDALDERAQKLLRIPEYMNREWLWNQVYDLAKQFDERNNNAYFHSLIQEHTQTVFELKQRFYDKRKNPEVILTKEIMMDEPIQEENDLSKDIEAEHNPDNMFSWAMSLLEKEDPHLQAQGEEWLKKAAEAGQLDARFHLSEMLLDIASTNKERAKGEKMLRELAEAGHEMAMNRLGFRLLRGLQISPDPIEGVNWIQRSAESGSSIGMFQYALCFLNGLGVPQDLSASEYWMRESAEEGYVPAMYILGTRLLEGDYIPKSPDEGEHWLRKAAEHKYLPAMHQLGSRLITGDKLAIHPYEGHHWLNEATERDYGPAIHELAFRLLDGNGLKQDSLQGEVLLRRAALLGEVGAMVELAGRLLNGDGIQQRPREGVQWLRKAAINQHPNAMYILGCYLLDYPELSFYEDEAIVWLRKAAEAGHEKAFHLLRELEENE